MSRPLLRWLLFAVCLAVLLGAMLWISTRTLDLEAQRKHAAEEAQRQERVRLALWRMDSLASVLLIRENARPASHYQAFYAPEELFAGGNDNRQIPKGAALQPSPLLGAPPDMVQLHFEVVVDTLGACSPQAPTGTQATMASQWSAGVPQTRVLSTKLAQISDLLTRHPELKSPQGPQAGEVKIISAAANDLQKPVLKEELPPEQLLANTREMSQRSKIVSQNIANEKVEMFNSLTKNGAPAEPKPRSRSSLSRLSGWYESSSAAPPGVDITLEPLPTLAGDLRPVWVENELLLLRHATLDGRARLQGVWLDWPKLRERLYETVRDLLPHAALIPISPEMANKEAAALVTLPVRLVPGVVPIQINGTKSALKPALAIAWICVLLAAVAIGFVLHRTMLLSERRGAFVSSVTHELRTPLTTFRLYSEMLADDMVPGAEQRRSYLQTLCDESTRLMHLVENVLAYSRIERGRTAARLETLTVEDLMQRMVPRLRQRAEQANLELQLHCPPEVAAARVRADALAVEQILFNLVDNACKYAAPDSEPRRLDLTAAATAKGVRLELQDFGPGLSAQARKKLFRPFAKSATEAAHSAPGVGLGLALCRRLARDLGGDLAFCPAPMRGACFRLSLLRA